MPLVARTSIYRKAGYPWQPFAALFQSPCFARGQASVIVKPKLIQYVGSYTKTFARRRLLTAKQHTAQGREQRAECGARALLDRTDNLPSSLVELFECNQISV